MSTFSGLTVPEGHKEDRKVLNGEVVKFKYPEVVADHYRYRGAVENHNALSHDGVTKSQFSLESKLGTAMVAHPIFLIFLMARTEVNAYLGD